MTEVFEARNRSRTFHCPSAGEVAMSLLKLVKSLPFSGVFRKLEQDMETVVRVLQPGPLGIVEHKFTPDEIREANNTVQQAVENWRRRARLEKNSGTLKDYIEK
ncbi:hypothetical protein Nepgr_027859 [Nepenthes gracilis]|uniref:Uncharacterized protein n=1 Tax=Nepenthes gracilis TaxID=150966 RepID=A0AAD3TC47_NEPGR|nr:hypothetical protein Nepgr_027859 [Nepenthes gracilis]